MSTALPFVWMRSEDAARVIIATAGERAEVAPDREDGFDVPLYTAPTAAPNGWEIVQADSRHISVKHPDGTWATIADTGPLNNMMFYEMCLAMLAAQDAK